MRPGGPDEGSSRVRHLSRPSAGPAGPVASARHGTAGHRECAARTPVARGCGRGTATVHTYLELARLASLQNRIDDTVAALTAAAAFEPTWAELPHRVAMACWEYVRRSDVTDPVVQLAYIRKAMTAEDQALTIRRDYVPALIHKHQLLKMQATLTADPGEQKVLTAKAQEILHRAYELQQKRDRDAQSRTGSTNTSPPPFAGFAEPFEQTMARLQPTRIAGTIRPPKKITDVKPIYPNDAQASRVQGVVVVEVIIDELGIIANARILQSVPSLDEAALGAVSQWKYAHRPCPMAHRCRWSCRSRSASRQWRVVDDRQRHSARYDWVAGVADEAGVYASPASTLVAERRSESLSHSPARDRRRCVCLVAEQHPPGSSRNITQSSRQSPGGPPAAPEGAPVRPALFTVHYRC